MSYFSDSIIEQVRQAADIVSVISEHITLKRAGAHFQALCPFHIEKTPSFMVSPERQIFKCFGCGKAGNVFHFVMGIANVTFPEAVEKLATRCGIRLPEEERGEHKHDHERGNLLSLMEWAVRYFQAEFMAPGGQTARDYIQKRQFTPDTIERFQIGYAPAEYDKLIKAAQAQGFSMELLEKGGLVAKSSRQPGQHYDLFRNRVMFPIWNTEGKVVGFGGRTLAADGKPKYLNSPETPIFFKRKLLYALHQARKNLVQAPYLVVMEGYTDVMMAHQYQFCQAIATLGTSLSEDHAQLLRRYVDTVVLLYDGDLAGQNAMVKALTMFISHGLMLRVAILPDGMDPCDLLAARGQESFATVLQNAPDFLNFQIQKIANQYDLKNTQTRRMAIVELAKTIKQIPDLLTQRLYVGRIAEYFQIPAEMVMGQVVDRKPTRNHPAPAFDNCRRQLQDDQEEFLLWACLHYPALGPKVFAYYEPSFFQNAALADLAQHLAAQHNVFEIDVGALSAQLPPELAQKLVNIYYQDYGVGLDEDGVEKQLLFIFQSAVRQKCTAKFNKLKEILASTAANDDALKLKILEDARNLCKAKMQRFV